MHALDSSLQSTSYPFNHIEGNPFHHLPDEMTTYIFNFIPTTQLSATHLVSHDFKRIGEDPHLIKNEVQACKKLIEDVITRNPGQPKILEAIKAIEIKWEHNSWIAMMALSKKLEEALEGLSVAELALIVPPQQHVNAPLVDNYIHKQFQKAWLKKLENNLSQNVQPIRGCHFTIVDKEVRLRIDSSLEEKHYRTLIQIVAQNVLPVTEISFRREVDAPPIMSLLDEFLQALSTNKTIHSVRLQGCLVQDKEIGFLADSLKTKLDLENLYIDEFNFTVTGMQTFARMLENYPGLKEMSLEGWIDAEIQPLLESLGKLHLETLILSKGTLTARAADILAEALKTNTKLKTLNFSGTQFDANAIDTITEALWNNSTIQDLLIPGKYIPTLLARKQIAA